jgi:hypothetical protein
MQVVLTTFARNHSFVCMYHGRYDGNRSLHAAEQSEDVTNNSSTNRQRLPGNQWTSCAHNLEEFRRLSL